MMTTPGKVLVTGASEGIGRAFARRLAAEGYAVTAAARNESRLKELMTELDSDSHAYQVADLSTREGTGAVAEILAAGRFNLLINNAGFGVYGDFYKANQPPAAITQTPEDVVETAMLALAKRGKPTVVSGVKNRMVTNLTRLMSRKGIVKMMAGFG